MLAPLLAAVALAGTPIVDPQHLPTLPARGLAQWTQRGVVLETLRGRALGLLPGLHLAEPRATHVLLLQDRRARMFVVDANARRLRPVAAPAGGHPGCRAAVATMR